MTELSDLMQRMARGGYRLHQQWGLMTPEQPEAVGPTPLLSKPRSSIDRQAEGFDGKLASPMPLGGTNYIDGLTFRQLCSVADRYSVPHNEDQWLDDEFPDKEDDLRVAVAEAMEKVGK